MKFTFGIITSGEAFRPIQHIIESIKNENILEYEIIIVGGRNFYDGYIHIPFDESIKYNWITRKKNLITENAKFENIVYLHDYIMLEPGWYNGMLEFGNDFNICMNVIKNMDGTRFRDWCLWGRDIEKVVPHIPHTQELLLPYDVGHLSKYMYISGSFWIAKKYVMEEFKLDENLSWGEGEDVKWSMQVREKYDFKMNPLSTVKFMKVKYNDFIECTDETIKILKNIE